MAGDRKCDCEDVLTIKPKSNNYQNEETLLPKCSLAIWRGDEYILSFLFANRLQFQPTNNTKQ